MMVCGVLGALYGAWFVAIAVLGALKKPPETPERALRTRFAVVIPARNEQNVIGYLVRSLKTQDYPSDLYDIYVVPNGCTDETANVARAAGGLILDCDVETRSKGDVLRFAFGKLLPMEIYDAYCILDADNLAAPGFLRAANSAMQSGLEIAQGYRDSKNPRDSWVAGSMSAFFWTMNRFYNRSRAAISMSAALNGTGIVISADLLERLGWNARTLTEDLEFSAICAINGVKIGYMPSAVVYDEQPKGLRESMVQRRRWFSGCIQCLKIYGARLISKKSVHALDMLMIFGGCVMQIMGFIPMIITIISLMTGDIDIRAFALSGLMLCAAAYVACCGYAALICKLEGKLRSGMLPTILLFALFLVTWMPANIVAIFTPPPKWKHIAHVRGIDAPN